MTYKNRPDTGYIFHELIERVKIQKASIEHKRRVDGDKAELLQNIENEYVHREREMASDVKNIQTALLNNDPDRIKTALRNFQKLMEED